MEKEIIFEIVKELGVITDYSTGWTKELNIVSWNSNTPKLDIRDWNPDHEHMSRGITLHMEEGRKLKELLNKNWKTIKKAIKEYETTPCMEEENSTSVYEIVEYLGKIAEYSTGWKKELNVVSWNGNTPKIDIRDWSPDHEHMSRGIVLHLEEIGKLKQLLNDYFDDDTEEEQEQFTIKVEIVVNQSDIKTELQARELVQEVIESGMQNCPEWNSPVEYYW